MWMTHLADRQLRAGRQFEGASSFDENYRRVVLQASAIYESADILENAFRRTPGAGQMLFESSRAVLFIGGGGCLSDAVPVKHQPRTRRKRGLHPRVTPHRKPQR